MRPWLSKETAEKVKVLGSDYRDVLLQLVDEENLPSVLGGACTCKKEGGRCELSGAGPWKDGRVGWGPNAGANGEGFDIGSGSEGLKGSDGQKGVHVNGEQRQRYAEGSKEEENGPANDDDRESRIREGSFEKDMNEAKEDQSPRAQETLHDELEEPHVRSTAIIVQE
jgi:hypothetical protein